jgi:exodeoxyribonuclease VII small subunit
MSDPSSATPGPSEGDIASLNYEAARAGLVAVVTALESGAESLEESIALWERGEALAARCQEWLDTARTRLADGAEGGTPGGEPEGGAAS